jgi:lipopolysaccharide transport system permease protein
MAVTAHATTPAAVRTLLRHRGLLLSLVSRELKARYRGSALGFVWSLLNPLLLVGVFSLVFGKFLGPRAGGDMVRPYALFLVTGLFPWVWSSAALLEGTVSLSANAGLIRKAVFPMAVLPIVVVLSHLVHFLLALPIVLGALAAGSFWGHSLLDPHALLLPVVIAIQLVLLSGLALGLSVLHVHFKDVRDLLANLLQLMFFLAPILYPLQLVEWPWARALVLANPFTPFTLAYQDLLFFGVLPGPRVWLAMVAAAALSWAAGVWIHRRLEGSVSEAV